MCQPTSLAAEYGARRSKSFDVEPGPVLANVVLADEINRAPAKVQSALLEVMAERQVTIGGVTMRAPDPFFVLATQNPIETEGVFPLPEAQRDRFLMRIPVETPSFTEEREIVARAALPRESAGPIVTSADVLELHRERADIWVPEPIVEYAIRVVQATRNPAAFDMEDLDGLIAVGASPRASIGLVHAAQALALIRNQALATAQDVYDVAYDVLNHRIVLSFDALADDVSVDEVLFELLTTVPAPTLVR